MDAETRGVFTRLTDAVLVQSATNAQIVHALDRLDARLALPQPALSRSSLALLMVMVALTAMGGGYLGARAVGDQRRPLAVAARSQGG